MKIGMWIIYLIVFVLSFSLTLDVILYLQKKKIRQLKIDLKSLQQQVDQEPKIALATSEKVLILSSLEALSFKNRIEEPQTRWEIRSIYRNLMSKIKASMK